MNNLIKSANRFAIRLAFLLVVCSLFTHCNSTSSSNPNEIEGELRKADASVQNAIAGKNLDSLMSFYAEDACLLPTAEPMVKGKESIRAEWSHVFKIPNFDNKSTLTKVEVSKGGDIAYTMGTYQAVLMGEDGKLTQEPGKWVSIWKKQSNGEWRIIVDIYNTDIAPPDHK
jgi:ketosteroid isomerase-like protein